HSDVSNHFHVNTPLLESVSMSKMAGTAVYLKMENCQPSGSFKIRGVGHLCQQVGDAGWADVPIIAMETVGADCFNAAIKAGELVTLDDITSEAKCLGAKTVCRRAFELSLSGEATIISELVTDQEALRAVQMFLDEERVLVEMACGAALAAVYSGLIPRLQAQGRLPTPLRPLLVIVCGGSSINMEQLISLRQKLQS
uniref:L-serine ammonia-lyase n=1 Tax=Xiphophorus couchianus TaxID=32473 RepID=A0A3B5KXN4_9TELE